MIAVILVGFAVAAVSDGKAKPEASPHGEAVALVLRLKPAEVTAAEKGYTEDGKWWHDTVERSWAIKRPFAPGVIDSTHLFVVTYRIEGKEVGRWLVDTRKGTVDRFDAKQPANP